MKTKEAVAQQLSRRKVRALASEGNDSHKRAAHDGCAYNPVLTVTSGIHSERAISCLRTVL